MQYLPRSGKMIRVTAVATGKVQGVGYRQYVSECAHKLGLHGSVQNMHDGSVYMIAEGSPAALDDFIRLAWARGDMLIHVENLQVTEGGATGEFRGFWVKW
jgi:acylphosphatase